MSGKDADREHNDSFEKYYNKDLDLEEDQVPIVIYELSESAINFISQESYEKALMLLQKAHTMLEQIQANNNPFDQFVYLLTVHNMALCYQKLGALEECANCLEKCLKYLEAEKVAAFFNDPTQPSLRLKCLKYKCKTHMQVCALFSQVHKHREAAYHANYAIQISHFLIHDSENMCAYFTKELIQQKPLAEVSIIGNVQFSLLQKTAVKLLPVFQQILRKVALEDEFPKEEQGVPLTGPLPKTHHSHSKRLDKKAAILLAQEKSNSRLGSGNINFDVGEADMKNILGYLNQNEWIYSLNIGNIMQVAPLTMQDFLSSNATIIELTREYVLEKMCFLCVGYFCLGTEFRFLHQQNEVIEGVSFQRKDSEYWHGKAVELAISFLPSESPLVSHILMSYEKHHSPSNMAIPEDNQQDVKIRVVRQILGVESARLQPIIRYHPETDYRVKYIDIKPFDYHEIFSSTSTSNQRRNRNNDVRGTSSSLGRSNTGNGMRRSLQTQSLSGANTAKQSELRDRIFKQPNLNQTSDEVIDEALNNDIIVEDFSKQALTGVISPLSDPTALMRMDEQRSQTQKKSFEKKGLVQNYHTLNQTSDTTDQKKQTFTDIEITEQERQRSSEVGISQKHRRLQTSDLQKILTNQQRVVEHSSQIELPRDQNQDLQFGLSTEEQRKYNQERRARSSLSNRQVSQKNQMDGPAVGPIQSADPNQSSNLLAFNATQQRTVLNAADIAKTKNQRLIVEQMEDISNQRGNSRGGQRQKSQKRRAEQEDIDMKEEELIEIHNQIRNSNADMGHLRSNTLQQSVDFAHKRQHLIQNSNNPNQKGAAPITDVRAKRQSSNTIPANQIDDTVLFSDQGRQSAQLVQSLNTNNTQLYQTNSTRSKKINVPDKANIASHLNQQMLLQHMMQQPPITHLQMQQNSNAARGSQNQINQLYTQSMNQTQKITNPAPQSNSGSNPSAKRRGNNSQGSTKKQSQNNVTSSSKSSFPASTATSVLTNDQLIFMMQQKRDRLNQSQLVSTQGTHKNHLDDFVQNASINLNQTQLINAQQQQPTAGHIVNLNKLYANNRKTPTIQSDSQLQGSKYVTNPQQMQQLQASQFSQQRSGPVQQIKGTPQVKSVLQTGSQEQKRAQSQIGQIGNDQHHFLIDSSNLLAVQSQQHNYNRKASIENKVGGVSYPSSNGGTLNPDMQKTSQSLGSKNRK